MLGEILANSLIEGLINGCSILVTAIENGIKEYPFLWITLLALILINKCTFRKHKRR